ncbi:dedicator of cytokinesis protein 9-like isoform X2 [Branchiostoma lanceolatum]|uniref:dedicator of cytokinesis protein 9-like isoform X2 n=1 Tax=Branchiostoma lanceolatum TaxID=7740 RepID=UPI003451A06C
MMNGIITKWRRRSIAVPCETENHKNDDPDKILEEFLPDVAKVIREMELSLLEWAKPKLVEPIDYETFVIQKKTQIHHDPQRDMLNFPHDDISSSVQPREYRTVRSSVPPNAAKEAKSLLVKEGISFYTTSWSQLHYKYEDYGGSYHHLPRSDRSGDLPPQVYELDEADKTDEEMSILYEGAESITKQGFLYKAPLNSEGSIITSMRSFKRRFFHLKQLPDKSYVLDYYKDEKAKEAKGTIYLDSCTGVVKNSKSRKFGFEVRMQDGSYYYLAGEGEAEMDEWVSAINKVVQSNIEAQIRQGDEGEMNDTLPSPSKSESLRESLENSMHPELMKYARESDNLIAIKRKENRQKLLDVYPEMQMRESGRSLKKEDDRVYEEQFGIRFLVRCEELRFRLAANIAEEENGPVTNVEPFFTTLSLYDAKENKKISEDFHFDINDVKVRQLLVRGKDAENIPNGHSNGDAQLRHGKFMPYLGKLKEEWLQYPHQLPFLPATGLFSVTSPHPDIYLVLRIEKVLQGHINNCVEPYLKGGENCKVSQKAVRQAKHFCSRLGQYRMPFGWAARPVFKSSSGELDSDADFTPIFKQESQKLSDEDMFKHLADIKRPEKMSKLQPIPASLRVAVEAVQSQLPGCVTSSLVPVRPFPDSPSHIIREIEEFLPEDASVLQPFTSYKNNLYIYPLILKFDNQKTFAKARNIACCVEFRDSDDEDALPLKCIYSRPGCPVFTTSANAAVLHHNTTPDFYEEVKIALPTQLQDRHHLLFTFHHVSCDQSVKGSTKKKDNVETVVGYAWLPILKDGKINLQDEESLPISAHLPPGYLTHKPLGMGKIAGPEIKWVDGGKKLFTLSTRLASSIYSKDMHMNNFYSHCEKVDSSSGGSDLDMCKFLKSLHAADECTVVQFLPVLLNQLFRVMVKTNSEDVATNATRVLVHVVSKMHENGHLRLLQSYVKNVFVTEPVTASKPKTIHEELAKNMNILLRPSSDFLVIHKLMNHAWFFFEIIVKSMGQHLITMNRLQVSRHSRFPASYQFSIQSLLQTLMPHITQKHKENALEVGNANRSLANFIKRCFTYMDRGFVFKLINSYLDHFNPSDPKKWQLAPVALFELKFEFLKIVCSHEHYIPLNLPLQRKGYMHRFQDQQQEFSLTDDYCKHHFLVGLLLREVSAALHQPKDVRQFAVSTLRDLLAKHSFDDRYQSKAHQARIASLYLPFLSIILENVQRLNVLDPSPHTPTPSSTTSSTFTRSTHISNDNLANESHHTPLPTRSTSVDMNGMKGSMTRDTVSSSVWAHIAVGEFKERSNTLSGTPSGNISSPMPLKLDTKQRSDSNSSLSTEASNGSLPNMLERRDSERLKGGNTAPGHFRSASAAGTFLRHDKLDEGEIKDLLVCLLFILKNLNEGKSFSNLPPEILHAWWHQASESDHMEFFTILEICLHQFRYLGKKYIASSKPVRWSLCVEFMEGGSSRSLKVMTLPIRRLAPSTIGHRSSAHDMSGYPFMQDPETVHRAMLEANMGTEVGLTVLDLLALYTQQYKEQLLVRDGDNIRMKRVFDLYMSFLQGSQSETLLRHVFACLRSFINKFPRALFSGSAKLCGALCYQILKCCNSKLQSTRSEACGLLYLLMRSNYEHTKRRGFTRVHLQVIINVSQLISDVIGLSGSRFKDSLSIINNYANSDRSMMCSNFPVDVKDLTKRIRTVLMATAQMKEHENDPEMLVDLQYSLAKSYASNLELRKTWLESMARIHNKNGDFSEAAMCYIHVAALVAEYLKRKDDKSDNNTRTYIKGVYPKGCAAFRIISPNIEAEESAIKDDSGIEDVHYTEDTLVELLERCAQALEKAERYEVLGEVYKLIIPIYEKRREFQRLADAYRHLTQSYEKVVTVMQSGRRLLGTYFRVAFYGQQWQEFLVGPSPSLSQSMRNNGFFEEEDGREYIYKEPKVTSLSEINQRLERLYSDKFGVGNVKMIKESGKVKAKDLDPKYAYIQVTYCEPYFDEKELEDRRTDFEKNNTIRRFVFETPFTQSGKAHGALEEQHKRRTILTTSHSFPYVKKRVLVVYHKTQELKPVEVAVDEMQQKTAELRELVTRDPPDMKKLQLKLQGSVSVQVNAGPVAYASTFLDTANIKKYQKIQVEMLKEVFRQFICVCGEALSLNAQLIKTDQLEYHEGLKNDYKSMVAKLEDIMHEQLLPKDPDSVSTVSRSSLHVFSAISGTPTSASLAGISSGASTV